MNAQMLRVLEKALRTEGEKVGSSPDRIIYEADKFYYLAVIKRDWYDILGLGVEVHVYKLSKAAFAAYMKKEIENKCEKVS